MTFTPHEFSLKFGGMVTQIDRVRDEIHHNTFRCLVYDFGPNVVACGEGPTPEDARANTKKVRWGYALRLDFMTDLDEERKRQVGEWLNRLTSDEKEMICDILESRR